MDEEQKPEWLEELERLASPEWIELLRKPDGAAILRKQLPLKLDPENVAKLKTDERRVWELIGLYYRSRQLWYDAIAIYSSLYDHFLNLQVSTGTRVHKGMPLVWLADCYLSLGFTVISKKLLMLTLIEDAITGEGEIDPVQTGSYFRLAWRHGLSDYEIKKYSKETFEVWKDHPNDSLFPEWVLQELDQDWMVEIPSRSESSYYAANIAYVKHLINLLGDPTGKSLERLAEYLLSCMPGCRTSRRCRSECTDYDVVCSMQGADIDFRSELGRYFVVECKDWKNPVNFTSFAKFCRVLDSVKCRFGILFSNQGITGERRNSDAEREQQKVFQDRGMVIVVVNKNDLDYVSDGGNLIGLLRNKYEKVRLDLQSIASSIPG